MKSRRSFRRGVGFAQIMATILVVLPTMVFIMTMLLDYWSAMQADYKLKLVANLTADYMLTLNDPQDFQNEADYNTSYKQKADALCPGGTTACISNIGDGSAIGEIAVIVKYDYNGQYLEDKTLATKINAYSYKDKNISVTVTCQ